MVTIVVVRIRQTQTSDPEARLKVFQIYCLRQLFYRQHPFKTEIKCRNNCNMSCRMGKPTICIGENKGADHLRSNCEVNQRLCFRYTDSTNSSTF